jgi:hypothetical protein
MEATLMRTATPLLETMALRALAVVLAPALFMSAFAFALAALPVVGIERALSRA